MLPQDDLTASSHSRQLGRVLLVMCVLVLSSAWRIGRWEPPLDQNRQLDRHPRFEAGEILRTHTQKDLEVMVRDSVPAARLTVPMLAGVSDAAGFSLRSDVWHGKGDLLFLGADFDLPCRSHGDVAKLSNFLNSPQSQGDDPRMRFLMAPDKSNTLASQVWGGEFVGDQQDLTACQRDQQARLQELARRHPRSFAAVPGVKEAAAHFGQPSYFTGDSHWTPAGAAAAALLLGTWIAPSHTFEPSAQLALMRTTGSSIPGGDLYRLAGISKIETAPMVETTIPGSTVTNLDPSDVAVRTRSKATHAPLAGRTLMLVDSYFNSARLTLAPLFTDLTVITDKVDVHGYLDQHRSQFDHVIVLAVQRHAASTFAGLAPELPASLSPQPSASWEKPHWPAIAASR